MAIVKMKKLRVMAMADSREALLTGLLRLGCVEISEPDGKLADPAWAALLRREESRLIQRRRTYKITWGWGSKSLRIFDGFCLFPASRKL